MSTDYISEGYIVAFHTEEFDTAVISMADWNARTGLDTYEVRFGVDDAALLSQESANTILKMIQDRIPSLRVSSKHCIDLLLDPADFDKPWQVYEVCLNPVVNT